jgi:hypothetical protein
MVEVTTRFSRALTTGVLRWLGKLESDIVDLSKKSDGTKVLTDVIYLTIYHPTHYPQPLPSSTLYLIAYGGPAIDWRDGQPVSATVEYRLMKGTVLQADGSAAVVADAPLLGDIAEALLTWFSQLGKAWPGKSSVYTPANTLEERDFERLCRLDRAEMRYHAEVSGPDGNAVNAIAYTIVCTWNLGRY